MCTKMTLSDQQQQSGKYMALLSLVRLRYWIVILFHKSEKRAADAAINLILEQLWSIITHALFEFPCDFGLCSGFCLHAANSLMLLAALCFVALAPPPRYQHPRCFHYCNNYYNYVSLQLGKPSSATGDTLMKTERKSHQQQYSGM